MKGTIDRGYYVVRFYNYKYPKVCFWNGERFESFKSDFPHDEIEKVECSLNEVVENAHMAGQYREGAGVDPSYSDAMNYRMSKLDS